MPLWGRFAIKDACILSWQSLFLTTFYAKEQLTVVPLPHQKEEHLNYQVTSVDELDEALKAHRLMFFPSPKNGVLGQNDKTNAYEARLVALLLDTGV